MRRAVAAVVATATLLGTGLAAAQPALAAPPSNDNFADAQLLEGRIGSVDGTNVESTGELGEPKVIGVGPLRSVWYRWTSPYLELATFHTCDDTEFDTNLAVYTGTSLETLTLVSRSGNFATCGDGYQSRTTFEARAGTEYWIQVDGDNGATGPFTLTWEIDEAPPAPSNDNLADAMGISGLSGDIRGTTISATDEPGEPVWWGTEPAKSVWYSWTAPQTGLAELDLCKDTTFDTLLSVYTGEAVDALTLVTTGDNSERCGNQSYVWFDAIAGTEYMVQVDGYFRARGDFTLTWLLDPDTLPTVSIADTSVLEGDTGTTPAEFDLALSEPSGDPVTVRLSTVDGTATAGDDYDGASGTVTFAPGETSKTVQVSVIGDSVVEADEQFTVVVSEPAGAELGDAEASATILNDDLAADLALTMDANVEAVELGQVIRHDIDVTNRGPLNATSVTLVNPIPAGTVLDGYELSQGSCAVESDVLVCDLEDIPAGSGAEVVVNLRTEVLGVVTNTARVAAGEPDSDLTNNEASEDTEVISDAGDCTILGTSGVDVLVGTAGNDVICASGGDDVISAGAGHDVVRGGDGNDVVDGGPGRDRLDGEAGDDDLRGDAGRDVLIGGAGTDLLDGGHGRDTVSYATDPAGVILTLADGIAGDGYASLDFFTSIGIVRGSAFGDTLVGSRRQDTFYGGPGDDSLVGSGRSDFLSGGDGADRIDGGRGRDMCVTGETLLSCEF